MFKDGGEPKCLDAADANDDGRVDISDAVRILLVLFKGEIMAQPFLELGVDSTEDDLSCSG